MKQFIFPIKSGYPYFISQKFGERLVNYTTKGHIGYDIAVVIGTPVVAVADGVCVFTVDSDNTPGGQAGGYGNQLKYLTSKQEDEFYLHVDGHLLHCLVKPGDKVTKGQVIALSGNTGHSNGPHLHHDIRLAVEGSQPGFQNVFLGKTYTIPNYDNGYSGCYDYGAQMDGLEGELFNVDLRYGQAYSYLREKAWSLRYNQQKVEQAALAAGFSNAELPRLKNAFVYGYWDREFVFSTANYQVWREMTKPEFLKRIGK